MSSRDRSPGWTVVLRVRRAHPVKWREARRPTAAASPRLMRSMGRIAQRVGWRARRADRGAARGGSARRRTIEQVVRALGEPTPPPVDLDAHRLDARRRTLALDHAASRLDDDAYLAASRELRAQAARTRVATSDATQVRPDVAVAWLRDLGALWREATEDERARLAARRLRPHRSAQGGVRRRAPHASRLCARAGTRPARGGRCGCHGAPGRIRTRDLMVRSHPLYPLSYGRTGSVYRQHSRRRGVRPIVTAV
jgi:hypothetical protein